MQPSIHTDLFSDVAQKYDEQFSFLPHVVQLRKRIHQLILSYFPAVADVLELGCGTGEDACFMSSHGYHVVASDLSLKMLRVAQQKCAMENQDVFFVQLPAQQLNAIKDRSFDAIFSNFGGLNCIEDISHVLDECYFILRDNGQMIICLMNRNALWETCSYLIRGKFRAAFRRWKQSPVSVSVGGKQILTWYHSFRDIKSCIKNKFTIQKVIGLNVITPPPSSVNIRNRHPALIKILEAIERKVDALPIFSLFGDHYVLILERFE